MIENANCFSGYQKNADFRDFQKLFFWIHSAVPIGQYFSQVQLLSGETLFHLEMDITATGRLTSRMEFLTCDMLKNILLLTDICLGENVNST